MIFYIINKRRTAQYINPDSRQTRKEIIEKYTNEYNNNKSKNYKKENIKFLI